MADTLFHFFFESCKNNGWGLLEGEMDGKIDATQEIKIVNWHHECHLNCQNENQWGECGPIPKLNRYNPGKCILLLNTCNIMSYVGHCTDLLWMFSQLTAIYKCVCDGVELLMYFSLTWSLSGWEFVQRLLLHRAAGSQQPASDPSQQGSRTAGTYRYTADSTCPDQTEPLKTGQHLAWSHWLLRVYYRNY